MKTILVRFLVIGFCFFSSVNLKAQNLLVWLEPYKKEAEIVIGFNNRRTHIYNELGVIYGFKFGLNFDRKLKNTFGINGNIKPLGKPNEPYTNYLRARLLYFDVAEEYKVFKHNRFALFSLVGLGYGWAYRDFYNEMGNILLKEKVRIMPLEAGIESGYYIIKWLELRVGFGYRFFPLGASYNLSGYYFKIGAGIKSRILYNTLKAKKGN